MTRAIAVTLGLFLAGCGTPEPAPEPTAEAAAAPSRDAGEGWVTLFDGSGLEHWIPLGDANWRIADGVLEADGGGTGFLVSHETYDDFELHVEFWANDEANSGVFIRCQNPTTVTAESCYEVNIFDQRPDPTYRTGGIVDVAPPMAQIDAGGSWNTFHITADGPRLVVRLNDTLTVDTMDEKFPRGPFALQYAAGTVRFRNVQIRRLDNPS